MKTRLLSTAVAIVLLSSTALAGEEGWKKVAPEGGKFSVRLPAEPNHQKETKKTPFGEMTTHIYVAMDGEKGIGYVVGTCDLPAAIRGLADQSDTMMEALVGGIVEGAKGKLISKKKIRWNGNNGREVKARIFAGAGTLEGRAFLVDGRIFILMVMAPRGSEDADAASSFLGSFQLTSEADLLRP